MACKTEWWDIDVVILGEVEICIWPSRRHCHSDWFYIPGFTFLVPAHPGSCGQNTKGLKTVMCVHACVHVDACMCDFVTGDSCHVLLMSKLLLLLLQQPLYSL